MTKPKGGKDAGGKVTKGKGFEPPDIASIITSRRGTAKASKNTGKKTANTKAAKGKK